jgi:hypothetical protein
MKDMEFAAITFKIKPGSEGQIREIFSGFKRASSAVVRDGDNHEVAHILGTALFIKDDIMVRVIQYEGNLEEIAKFMGRQEGVREAEQRLNAYLVEPRDTSTREGFMRFFRNCSMDRLSQFAAPTDVIIHALSESDRS